MTAHVDHLTCQQLVDVLTDYLEGVLDPQRRADVERHIVLCRGCANYVEQMRSTIDLLARVAAEDPGDEQAEQLLGLFRRWRDERAEDEDADEDGDADGGAHTHPHDPPERP